MREGAGEDLLVEGAQGGPGVDAEVGGEEAASFVVDGQRVGLPAATVQRGHQLTARPLAQRVVPDLAGEGGDEVAVAAEGERRLGVLLQRGEPGLLQAWSLGLGELLGDVAEGRPVPESEGLGEAAFGVGEAPGAQVFAAGVGEFAEGVPVEGGPARVHPVAAGGCSWRADPNPRARWSAARP